MRHMTNCMDVSLTYWRKRHKKEMETESSFLRKCFKLQGKYFWQQKRGRCILEYLVTQLSFHYYMIPYIIKAIQQKNCGVLSGFI